jgi:hypothetical protein
MRCAATSPMNALFYDPVKEEVWDYVHGLKDVRARKLVMIGDASVRYREDPVRMLRAARLAAKLGFTIDPRRAPDPFAAHLLENVPQARLFEEILKLLLSGNAVECVRLLRELELHHGSCRSSTRRSTIPSRGPSRWRRCARPTSGSRPESPCRPHFSSRRCCGARSRGTSSISRRRGSRPSRRSIRRCTRRSTSSAIRSRSRAASTRP